MWDAARRTWGQNEDDEARECLAIGSAGGIVNKAGLGACTIVGLAILTNVVMASCDRVIICCWFQSQSSQPLASDGLGGTGCRLALGDAWSQEIWATDLQRPACFCSPHP